uniref:IQ motif containing H n=1 Tax=Macrostomum lignano TaxID=282301 RepID=A0A1I8FPV1_9PLAT
AGRLLGEARDLVDCACGDWKRRLADCADQNADTSIIDTSGVVSVLADPRLRSADCRCEESKADELGFAGRLDGSHLLQPSVLVVRWPTRPFYVLLPQRRLVWSDRPPALPPAPLLTREEAEEASRIRETSLPFIITLQAAMRGFLVRRRLRERRQLYSNSLDQIVAIQRWWRRCQRDRQLERRLARVTIAICLLLFKCRLEQNGYRQAGLQRTAHSLPFVGASSYSHSSLVRAAVGFGQQYQRLCDPSRPVTLSSLRPFLQAAEHSWSDYHQEIELVRVRAEIVEEIRQCQKVERQLSEMDTKIGLLVRKSTHSARGGSAFKSAIGRQVRRWRAPLVLPRPVRSRLVPVGLTRQQVEKEAKKIELYQQLVHLLQTQPVYLTSSLQQTPESLPLLQLFNYLEGDREQYLYMRLFCSALPQELARLYRPAEVLSPTPGLGKLLSGMSKAGQACLSTLLRPLVGACLRDSSLSPAEVYALGWPRRRRRAGVPAGLPYQALEQPEVRVPARRNVRALRQTAGQFVRALTQCRLPYSVRLAAKCIREYLVPMLANSNSTCPEKDAIKLTCQMQRRTLGSVAKMLQLAAANKGFGAESCSHLHCLNRSLREWHQSLKDLLLTECRETADPGAEFDMDEYSEMARLTVPTLHISVDDLQTLHLDLLDLRPSLTDPADPLAEILDELERVADGARPLLSAASSSSSSQSGRVTLHLSPRHDPLDLDYLSRADRPGHLGPAYQAPITLDELIRSTSTPAEERRHELLLKSRERLERQVRTGTGWRSRSNLKEGGLPLDAKKSRVLEALDRLAGGDAAWSVDRLLRELADDIRQWHGQAGQAEAGAGQAVRHQEQAAGLETAVPGGAGRLLCS